LKKIKMMMIFGKIKMMIMFEKIKMMIMMMIFEKIKI